MEIRTQTLSYIIYHNLLIFSWIGINCKTMNSKIFSMNRTFLGSNLVTISKMWLNNPLRLYASIYRILLRLCKLNNLCASIAVEKSFVCYWNLLLLSIRKSPMCFCPFWCTHHHAIQEFLQKCHQNFLLIFPKEILHFFFKDYFRYCLTIPP